jgi:hypothetical protein
MNDSKRYNPIHGNTSNRIPTPTIPNAPIHQGEKITTEILIKYIETHIEKVNEKKFIKIDEFQPSLTKVTKQSHYGKKEEFCFTTQNLENIFDKFKISKTGVFSYVDVPSNVEISIISSIVHIFFPEILIESEKRGFCENFIRKIQNDSCSLFNRFKYDKLGWIKKEFTNNLSKMIIGKDILRYIADYMYANLFIADIHLDTLFYVGPQIYVPYKKNIFLIKYKDDHFEPIEFIQEGSFLSSESKFIKKLIEHNYLVEYINNDIKSNDDNKDFMVNGQENLELLFPIPKIDNKFKYIRNNVQTLNDKTINDKTINSETLDDKVLDKAQDKVQDKALHDEVKSNIEEVKINSPEIISPKKLPKKKNENIKIFSKDEEDEYLQMNNFSECSNQDFVPETPKKKNMKISKKKKEEIPYCDDESQKNTKTSKKKKEISSNFDEPIKTSKKKKESESSTEKLKKKSKDKKNKEIVFAEDTESYESVTDDNKCDVKDKNDNDNVLIPNRDKINNKMKISELRDIALRLNIPITYEKNGKKINVLKNDLIIAIREDLE